MSSSTHFVVVLLLSLQHINFIYFEREEERERGRHESCSSLLFSFHYLASTNISTLEEKEVTKKTLQRLNERTSEQTNRKAKRIGDSDDETCFEARVGAGPKERVLMQVRKTKKRSDIYGRNKSLGIERKH